MDLEVIDTLEDLRYPQQYDELTILDCLSDWSQYSNLVQWICTQFKTVGKLDENVNPISNNQDDVSSFQMELSALLKELCCPYSKLMDGPLVSRFDTSDKRLLALHFLLNELIAAKILNVDKPKDLQIQLEESKEARLLREILQTLESGVPPPNITIPNLIGKIIEKLGTPLKKIKDAGIDNKPIFTGVLSNNQWNLLDEFNRELKEEYRIRREMLLKRLDVTVQSFHWSDRLADKKDRMTALFQDKRQYLSANPQVELSHILAPRSDLAYIEKTSSASVRKYTKSAINSVVIGKVPDRGGRPSEAQAPPPEMPPWQKRQGGAAPGTVGWNQPQRSDRGGRGGHGHRGGQVQGGWSGDHGNRGGHVQGGWSGDHGNRGGVEYRRGGGGHVQGGWSDHGGGRHDQRNRDNDDHYRGRGGYHGGSRGHDGGGYRGNRGRGGY